MNKNYANRVLKANDMTVSDLCRKMGIERSTYYYMIKHDNKISTIKRFAECVGLTLSDLFSGKVKPDALPVPVGTIHFGNDVYQFSGWNEYDNIVNELNEKERE